MFDIGAEKLLMVLVIGVLVLGPERIPEVARRLGRARAEVRRLARDVDPDALRLVLRPREALVDALAEFTDAEAVDAGPRPQGPGREPDPPGSRDPSWN
jgi:Sec-independent protein translocase protein TatA